MMKRDPVELSLASASETKFPWVPIQAQMQDHSMTVAGVPARTFYRDAKVFIETCKQVAAYYRLDRVSLHADVYNFEIEAMGGKMVYSDNAMPTIDFRDPLIKQPKDLPKLKVPDFRSAGRLPYALDCMKLSGTKSGSFCGIFSMAVGMRTYPALIKDMRKRPEFVRDLFMFIIDQVLLPYLKVQKEYCGITSATGAGAWVTTPGISVREMNEWVLPYDLLLKDKAKKLDIVVWPGGGDYSEQDPDRFDLQVLRGALDFQMATRGGRFLSLWHGAWDFFPLGPVQDYSTEHAKDGVAVPVDAGVSPRLLRDGPVEKIVAIIKRHINTFARGRQLTVRLVNIPADTPPDHVHAAVAAVHTYGKLPIASDLHLIDYKLPVRETFQEWKRAQTVPPIGT